MALFTVLLPVLTVLSVLAIVIGTALSVRPSTTSAALLARVRSHGAATAVTALLLGSISGFAGLAAEARPEGTEWTWDAGEWHGVPVFLDAVWLALALALLPAILVAAVTVGAQRSVPAPQGRVRRAVLTPRTAASLVPRGPALPGVGIGLALGATLVLLWAEPSVPATLAVALVLLLWRPPALGELRTGPGIDRARTAETVRTETA